jgi:FkbM family methyltransferase
VYTFEPNPQNFYCLVNNVCEGNVVKFQACLGENNSTVGITYKKSNSGVSRVEGSGIFPTLKIDDLGLNCCDLIHLDIEGYEYFALKGGINTIKTFRPIIALEWLDHNNKFNVTSTEILGWLTELGYKEVGSLYHEKVFAAL